VARRFGSYLLLRRLAVGGMAEVFLARREGIEGFQKTIVIKRIRQHLSEQPAFVKMFLNEARLAAELIHSNIAQVFDLGRVGKFYFIAMEYVNGRDMRQVIPQAQKKGIFFPLEYSLKIARDVCEGLYYAHRKTDDRGSPLNIVHRDITPENIMVSFDGEVKILDFGVAKAENLVGETRAGEVKGKLGYLSPEQITGKTVDHRADIFSLGVVLYEWLCGRRLFSGNSDVEVLKSVIEGRIYPPSYFKPEVPRPVEEIVLRALERNRELRYQSAWDMLADIDIFLSGQRFVPTNIHLSNFMRQIFAEELSCPPPQELAEEEAVPAEEGEETRIVETARGCSAGETAAKKKRLELELAAEHLRALSELARRKKLQPAELAAEVVSRFAELLEEGTTGGEEK
jgi:serine/threonine protein kinase